MVKEWLTDELDSAPYIYNPDKLEESKKELDCLIRKINKFYDANPAAREQISSELNNKQRFTKSALSYMELEEDKTLSTKQMLDLLKNNEYGQIKFKQLEAYQYACETAHLLAQNPFSYLDEQLFVRLNNELRRADIDRTNMMRMGLRDENDSEIIVGKAGGYFAPVPGEKVKERISILLYHFSNTWADDNLFAKCAKFVVEYVRIQPHTDGNKRVALMALNFILEKNGYSGIYFSKNQIQKLYDRIKDGMLTRDVTGLAELIISTLDKRYTEELEQIISYKLIASGAADADSLL